MKHAKYSFSPILFIFDLDTGPKKDRIQTKIQNIHYLVLAYSQKPLNLYSLKVIMGLMGTTIKVIIRGHLCLIQNRNHSNSRYANTELFKDVGLCCNMCSLSCPL